MLAPEESGKRLLARLDDDAFPHPLPELRLCRPKLFPVAADHERCFLLTLLLHSDTPRPLRVVLLTQKPVREASLARQHPVVNLPGANQTSSRPYNCQFNSCSRKLIDHFAPEVSHCDMSFLYA